MCQSCYKYYLDGGTDNPIPPVGKILHDCRGYVICHICGRSYKRLGSHVRKSHGMTIEEYKRVFGLCNNAKTTESVYSTHMRTLAYKNNMPEMLREAGKKIRIKVGENNLRLGKKSRMQECLDRSERYKNNKNRR